MIKRFFENFLFCYCAFEGHFYDYLSGLLKSCDSVNLWDFYFQIGSNILFLFYCIKFNITLISPLLIFPYHPVQNTVSKIFVFLYRRENTEYETDQN